MKAKTNGKTNELLKIAAQLREKVGTLDPGPSWREKARAALLVGENADPATSNRALIRSIQITRDAGGMDDKTAFYLIVALADQVAQGRIEQDAELVNLSWRLGKIEEREGLSKDEYFAPDDPNTPEDYRELTEAFSRRVGTIAADVLREHGEDKIADALLADPIGVRIQGIIELKRYIGEGTPGLDK